MEFIDEVFFSVAMALSTKHNFLKVKSYTINQAEVLGTGAFGVVHKGFYGKKIEIAAKRIDGDEHPRVLTQDLDRLMQLESSERDEDTGRKKESKDCVDDDTIL